MTTPRKPRPKSHAQLEEQALVKQIEAYSAEAASHNRSMNDQQKSAVAARDIFWINRMRGLIQDLHIKPSRDLAAAIKRQAETQRELSGALRVLAYAIEQSAARPKPGLIQRIRELFRTTDPDFQVKE